MSVARVRPAAIATVTGSVSKLRCRGYSVPRVPTGNSHNKEAVLVAHGIARKGKRLVCTLSLGGRESTESWKGGLNDLVERDLRRPQLFIADGNQGLLKATQRCLV
jgi:transposase-like protein